MIYLSPTQVKLFRLCMRKWAFAYIEKIKQPTTDKQQFGTDVHEVQEKWLSKGAAPPDTPEGRVAKQGIRPGWLPTPGPKLEVERKLEIDLAGMVDGVTLTGFADCIAPPGYEGIVEPVIIDHKSTSNLKWAMKAAELSEDPQGVIYAYYAMRRWKVRRARSRWVYYAATNPDKGPRKPAGAKMVEWLFDMDTILWQRTFEKLLNDLAMMRDAHLDWADAEAAPPDPRGCGAYGGCHYALKCNMQPADALATAIMQDGREHFGLQLTPQCGTNGVPDNPAVPGAANSVGDTAMTMSLIDKLKQMKAQAAEQDAPAEAPESPVEAPAEPTPAQPSDDERATLLAKLRAMGDAKAVNPAPDSAPDSAPEVEPEAEEEGDDLDGKLKGELAAMMQARGTPVPTGWTKARILTWLRSNPEEEVEAAEVNGLKPSERGIAVKATDPEGAKARAEAESDARAEAMHPEAMSFADMEDACRTAEAEAKCGELLERARQRVAEAEAVEETVPPPKTGGFIPSECMPPLPNNRPNPVTGDMPQGMPGFVVMFDAVYAKNETIANGVKHLGDVVKPIADIVAKDNGVEHWGLVEFARGGPMLAAKFERMLDVFEHQGNPMTGVILADSRTAEAKALRDVLIRRAGVVVQGLA